MTWEDEQRKLDQKRHLEQKKKKDKTQESQDKSESVDIGLQVLTEQTTLDINPPKNNHFRGPKR